MCPENEKQQNNNKDKITAEHIKYGAEIAIKIFTDIFNCIVILEHYPIYLKSAS